MNQIYLDTARLLTQVAADACRVNLMHRKGVFLVKSHIGLSRHEVLHTWPCTVV